MKILLIHSYYQQRGGEDAVFEAERDTLIAAGHEVETYVIQNKDYARYLEILQVISLFWNPVAYRKVRKQIQHFKPEIVHVHNLFPFFSPSVFWAAKKEKVPVVMTLHNYRLLCSNALLYREDKLCEKCVRKHFAWPAVRYGCYRQSHLKTMLGVLSQWLHWEIKSWDIPRNFIVPTEFAAQKLLSQISPKRICVKPHFTTFDSALMMKKNNHVIFVGRFSEEKGLYWLLKAWEGIKANVTLDIVGDGEVPIYLDLRIKFHGIMDAQNLHRMLAQSAVLVVPSRCYETFGKVVVEAFAAGTPVIAPHNTAPGSLVREGETGALFARDDVARLQKLIEEYAADPIRAEREGKAARAEYEQKYQAAENVEQLLHIYRLSLEDYSSV